MPQKKDKIDGKAHADFMNWKLNAHQDAEKEKLRQRKQLFSKAPRPTIPSPLDKENEKAR